MALRSSSMSGQWTPCPVPIISKCCRCSGVALAKRHDHTSGTLMVRPSARCAVIRSSVTSTERIRGSLLATMVMPCLQETRQVLHNKGTNPVQFVRGKSHDSHSRQPGSAKTYTPSARGAHGRAVVPDNQSCRRTSDRDLEYREPWACHLPYAISRKCTMRPTVYL